MQDKMGGKAVQRVTHSYSLAGDEQRREWDWQIYHVHCKRR